MHFLLILHRMKSMSSSAQGLVILLLLRTTTADITCVSCSGLGLECSDESSNITCGQCKTTTVSYPVGDQVMKGCNIIDPMGCATQDFGPGSIMKNCVCDTDLCNKKGYGQITTTPQTTTPHPSKSTVVTIGSETLSSTQQTVAGSGGGSAVAAETDVQSETENNGTSASHISIGGILSVCLFALIA